MGFFSASCSLYRFQLAEKLPTQVWSNLLELLRQNRFREIEDSSQERGYGWVNIEDMLDTQWESSSPFKGSYAAFALRLDTRRISAAVYKKHYRIALNQLQEKVEQNGGKFVSREQKNELRERVRLELLSRTLPVPAIFDVVWDARSDIVYLVAGQAKIKALFLELFYQSFGIGLEPLTPYRMARNQFQGQDLQELYSYEPAVFV